MEENSIRFEDIPNAITGVLKKLSSLEDKIDGIYELVQSEKEEHGLRLLNYVLISQHIR